MLTVLTTAAVALASAIAAALLTSFLSRGREREADWRKLKFAQYQEFALALSGVVGNRVTDEDRARYAAAVNSMSLIAPIRVLRALDAFQNAVQTMNAQRGDENETRRLSNILFHEMRNDMHSSGRSRPDTFHIQFKAPPR